MGCNCTANLRADIIKRFFANDARHHEFALELIRIVECQQTVMSLDLQEWFRIYFGFSDILFEEFLACVMKRQTTMSAELQKVIRSRYFPTSQQMALDFIRVVLCACCPRLCGSDLFIIGISNNYTVDGWYLEQSASNIVYMESGVITETVPCESGIAEYGHSDGKSYEYPHFFNGGTWVYLILVTKELISGTDYVITVEVDQTYSWGVANGLVEYSLDNGSTWIELGTFEYSPSSLPPYGFSFDEGTDEFLIRATVTAENGCQFFNPAPSQSQPFACYNYVEFEDTTGNAFLNWTINGVAMDNFNDMVTYFRAYGDNNDGGVGYDFTTGNKLFCWYVGNTTPPALTVLDFFGDPVAYAWVSLGCGAPVLSSYETTFTVSDASDCIIYTLTFLSGAYLILTQTTYGAYFTSPGYDVAIAAAYDDLLGQNITVDLTVVGNDITIRVNNCYVPLTEMQWGNSSVTQIGIGTFNPV